MRYLVRTYESVRNAKIENVVAAFLYVLLLFICIIYTFRVLFFYICIYTLFLHVYYLIYMYIFLIEHSFQYFIKNLEEGSWQGNSEY